MPFQRTPAGLLMGRQETSRGLSMTGHQLNEKNTWENMLPLSQTTDPIPLLLLSYHTSFILVPI